MRRHRRIEEECQIIIIIKFSFGSNAVRSKRPRSQVDPPLLWKKLLNNFFSPYIICV